MIDLHCHLLPGLDDGAATIEDSVAMAEAALADGVTAIVATPHVSQRFRTDPHAIRPAVDALSRSLRDRDVAIGVHPGAEVAVSHILDLDDDALRACCVGDGPYLLLEPSFSNPMPFLDRQVFELGLKGIRPLLVHPERSLHLRRDRRILPRLVARGAGLVVNAGSLSGAFGDAARETAWRLFADGLVHAVASDAHEALVRAPVLAEPLAAHAIDAAAIEFLTVTAPAAILAGEPLPPDPPRLEQRSLRRRLFRRGR